MSDDLTMPRLPRKAAGDAAGVPLAALGIRTVPPPPSSSNPIDSPTLMAVLEECGYAFRMNTLDDSIEVGIAEGVDAEGARVYTWHARSDALAAVIRRDARNQRIKHMQALEDAYIAVAREHSYHPIRSWLTGLVWDGVPRIATLATYLTPSAAMPLVHYPDGSSAPLHAVYLTRWLLGAVGKVLSPDGLVQTMMLVMDGPQGCGKSTFARWLASVMEAYFIESAIDTKDKDTDMRLLRKWIWEVAELDATVSRADVSALKAIVTRLTVTTRKAYGRDDIHKPVLASLIGTINNTMGFLADDTGSRRFWVFTITTIDRRYQQIPIDQIWAEAVALWQSGERNQLSPIEDAVRAQVNATFEAETTFDDYIPMFFDVTGDPEHAMTMSEIARHLTQRDVQLHGSERTQAVLLARVLTRAGVQKIHTRRGNVWIGIAPRLTDIAEIGKRLTRADGTW